MYAREKINEQTRERTNGRKNTPTNTRTNERTVGGGARNAFPPFACADQIPAGPGPSAATEKLITKSYVRSFVPAIARALDRSLARPWFESSFDGGRTNSRTYSNSEVVLNGSIVRAFERSHGPAEPCELEYVLLFGRPWRNILFAQILKPLKFYTLDFESSNRSYF